MATIVSCKILSNCENKNKNKNISLKNHQIFEIKNNSHIWTLVLVW
jgi:hypothetical protein